MAINSRLLVFTLAASAVYLLALVLGWPLFVYYPQVGAFHLPGHLPTNEGPPMKYYGWMAAAGLAGLAAAVAVPLRVSARLPSSLAWAVPLAVALYIVVVVE
jgi:hypothetical protein